MAGRIVRVILDTNVLVSAIVYGGAPKEVLNMVLRDKIIGITSVSLMAELSEVVYKKFPFRDTELEYFEEQVKLDFEIIRPRKILKVVRDDDDNRVLEAAIEGRCEYVVTGDRDLLDLKSYGGVKILTPAEFLNEINTRLYLQSRG